MVEKYQNKYRIASARAVWHDYDDGMYFITICTQNRKHFFGEIFTVGETFHETSLQRPPDETSLQRPPDETSLQRPPGETSLHKEMQLTPIGRFVDEQIRQIAMHYAYATIPVWVVMPNHIHLIVAIDRTKTPHKKRDITSPKQLHNMTLMQSWLSVVIRQLKSAVTHYAIQNNIPFAWQSRFHDHIIRSHRSLCAHTRYIENNVINWSSDCFVACSV